MYIYNCKINSMVKGVNRKDENIWTFIKSIAISNSGFFFCQQLVMNEYIQESPAYARSNSMQWKKKPNNNN